MKRYLSWSGGKDSTASIIVCYEKGIPLDGIVMAEVMFDHKRGISGENPRHIEWVYNTAIPIIEKQLGYKVIIVKSESDYVQEFYHVVTKSKHPERNGKHQGFFLGGMCLGNSKLKMQPLRKFFKEAGKCEQIVGVAADEPTRLARLGINKRSVLSEFGIPEFSIFEADTYKICNKYNLLSPIYGSKTRGGCWFCPNQSEREFADLKKHYPHLWNELKIMSLTDNLKTHNFKYGKTFADVEKEVDRINRQITMWDYIEEGINNVRADNKA